MKQFGPFRLDSSNQCLWNGGARITLAPKPFAILRFLVENPGRLITHDELLDALWPETYVQPQVLRTYMLELRKVLADDAAAPRFIQTLPKRGYCFVARVSEAAPFTNRAVIAASPGPDLMLPVLIDRDQEMHRLEAAVQATAGGQRQVVFLSGQPGIGKTALVDEFLRRTGASQPVTIARGQCVEALAAREQYYPVMEALSQLCASPDGERACRILSRIAPQWLAALGREPAEVPLRPAAERLPGELCTALEELALESSLIFVFEDLHWADDSTLALISALARRRTPARLMVLATFRAQDGSTPLKTLKQDLVIHRLCVELVLEPLDRGAVAQLLSRELGQEPHPAGLDDLIYRRSEGNPLFVIAMVEHLIAERYLVRGAASWSQRTPLPEMESSVPIELSQMIELEIERLDPRDQNILEAASLMNPAFPAWAVAAALEADPAEIEGFCDDLTHRLHFVRRGGQDELPDGTRCAYYIFAHGLYREVLYQRQSAARRARRHTCIAERLARLFAGREVNVAAEMAMHYEAAGAWDRASGVLRSAARHALDRGAHAESAALLEQALHLAENLDGLHREAFERDIRVDLDSIRDDRTPTAPPNDEGTREPAKVPRFLDGNLTT